MQWHQNPQYLSPRQREHSGHAACYHEAVPLTTPQPELTPQDAARLDAHLQQGQDLLADDDSAGAEKAFRHALALDAGNVEAHHGLIRALTEQGRPEGAIAAALALTVLTPSDPLAHAGLSIALMRAGHIQQAEAAGARARILEWKQQLTSPAPSEAFPIA